MFCGLSFQNRQVPQDKRRQIGKQCLLLLRHACICWRNESLKQQAYEETFFALNYSPWESGRTVHWSLNPALLNWNCAVQMIDGSGQRGKISEMTISVSDFQNTKISVYYYYNLGTECRVDHQFWDVMVVNHNLDNFYLCIYNIFNKRVQDISTNLAYSVYTKWYEKENLIKNLWSCANRMTGIY